MKKRVHANSCCLLVSSIIGPCALVCWQEGYSLAAAALGLAFLTLGIVGAVTARLHWISEPRDRAKARRIVQAVERDGYWISEEGSR